MEKQKYGLKMKERRKIEQKKNRKRFPNISQKKHLKVYLTSPKLPYFKFRVPNI